MCTAAARVEREATRTRRPARRARPARPARRRRPCRTAACPRTARARCRRSRRPSPRAVVPRVFLRSMTMPTAQCHLPAPLIAYRVVGSPEPPSGRRRPGAVLRRAGDGVVAVGMRSVTGTHCGQVRRIVGAAPCGAGGDGRGALRSQPHAAACLRGTPTITYAEVRAMKRDADGAETATGRDACRASTTSAGCLVVARVLGGQLRRVAAGRASARGARRAHSPSLSSSAKRR